MCRLTAGKCLVQGIQLFADYCCVNLQLMTVWFKGFNFLQIIAMSALVELSSPPCRLRQYLCNNS